MKKTSLGWMAPWVSAILIGLPAHNASAQSTPPGYTWCANEGGSCSYTGWKLLSYGNNNSFTYRWAENGSACNNTTFGSDPLPGMGKVCAVSAAWGTPPPSGYTQCASEYGSCSFSGTQLVGFGYSGYYVYKQFTGSAACTVQAFGVDPSSGNTKVCIVASSGTTTTPTPSGGTINDKLGKPNRLLVGLGAGNNVSDMQSQGLKPDVIDTYLVGVGSGSWTTWSSTPGDYVTSTAQQASSIGAVPMYTLYQMAQNGDGNISAINTSSFMSGYWSQVRLMFQKLGSYGKPALVNLEPDFWGYVQLKTSEPSSMAAVVNSQSECASLANNVVGLAQCLQNMARTYAPKTLVGFPASFFGQTAPQVAAFMKKLGAQNADFIVAQTSDRDAGCMEVASPPPECSGRGKGPFYWDESNKTAPNYTQSQTQWRDYASGLGNNLPIAWWQTPMGVPSTSPGGYDGHYRDNKVHYMLNNAWQYGDMHSFAIVFSSGASSQTTITTDNGQFRNALSKYLSSGGVAVK